MEIASCGITQIPQNENFTENGLTKSCLWIKGFSLPSSVAVCINSQLMLNTVVSEDRSVLTVTLPKSLVFSNCDISIQLVNLRSGERSNVVKVNNQANENNSWIEKNGKHVLISCFPKSGSTLLLKLLTKTTGFLSWPMVFEYGGNEQDIYLPSVADAYSQNTVTQQHVRATKTNLKIIREYDFKVVVLTRNIFDTLVSLHDHLINESYEIPLLYVDADFESLNFENRINMLIDLALPWYVDFYASWFKSNGATQGGTVLWIGYEQLVSNPNGVIKNICDNFQIPLNMGIQELENILSHENDTRLNVGRPGRGIEMLTAAQRKRVFEIMMHHPKVDFSRIV